MLIIVQLLAVVFVRVALNRMESVAVTLAREDDVQSTRVSIESIAVQENREELVTVLLIIVL